MATRARKGASLPSRVNDETTDGDDFLPPASPTGEPFLSKSRKSLSLGDDEEDDLLKKDFISFGSSSADQPLSNADSSSSLKRTVRKHRTLSLDTGLDMSQQLYFKTIAVKDESALKIQDRVQIRRSLKDNPPPPPPSSLSKMQGISSNIISRAKGSNNSVMTKSSEVSSEEKGPSEGPRGTSRSSPSAPIVFDTKGRVHQIVQDGISSSSDKLDVAGSGGVPPLDPRKMTRAARKNAPATAGSKWFDLPAPQLTPELKHDVHLIRNRNFLDPKRHYKTDDKKSAPKYFQIGTVIEGPADFYSSRIPKSQRRQHLVDELMADSNYVAYAKRKYGQLQKASEASGKGAYRKKRMTKKRVKR